MSDENYRKISKQDCCWNCMLYGLAIIETNEPTVDYCFKRFKTITDPKDHICDAHLTNSQVKDIPFDPEKIVKGK